MTLGTQGHYHLRRTIPPYPSQPWPNIPHLCPYDTLFRHHVDIGFLFNLVLEPKEGRKDKMGV